MTVSAPGRGRRLAALAVLMLLAGLAPPLARAQDTLRLTLPQAEALFLQRNLALLAQKYNISATEAAVVQARLFPNPQASFEYNLYNPATGKFFPTDASQTSNGGYNGGQYIAEVTQLIQLAGKRSKLVRLAQTDQQLASYQFADLMRTLRLTLRTTYAALYFNLQQLNLYLEEQQRLGQLLAASRISLQRGIVSPYEITRLEAESQDVAATVADLRSQIAAEEGDLKILLSDLSAQAVLPAAAPPQRTVPLTPTLRDSALARRPDYQYALAYQKRADLNLNYQRAQAVPDLTVGVNHESLGNAFTNYNGLSVAIDLPFFSRNQGQIKAAKVGQKQAENALTQAQATVFADVDNARRALAAYQTQAQGVSADYLSRLSELSRQADRAYRNRTISLLDYLDKFRTYKTGTTNQLNLQENLFIATETLATAAGMP